MTRKKCDHCKNFKEEEDFNWKFKALGVRHKTCRECMALFQKRYFQGDAHDRHLANVKERKDAARAVAREYVWDIQAEIDKCDVLCANCHRRHTMKERGWFRGRK